jgi:hypothetical protein
MASMLASLAVLHCLVASLAALHPIVACLAALDCIIISLHHRLLLSPLP